LKAAIQSREGGLRTLPATALASTVYTVTLPVASETISRFNRDTRWLATGVLGVLVCAVLVLAVLVQERKPKADDLTVVDANSSDGFTVTGLNGKSSGDKTTSRQASSVDQASTEISAKEKSSPQMEAAVSMPTTVLGFAPDISHSKAGLNTFSWTPVVRQGSARVIGPRTRTVKNRSSFGFGTVDVKRRLIELWHESLARNAKSRSWTAFSNLSKGQVKKPPTPPRRAIDAKLKRFSLSNVGSLILLTPLFTGGADQRLGNRRSSVANLGSAVFRT
jgi:hypothetical protein